MKSGLLSTFQIHCGLCGTFSDKLAGDWAAKKPKDTGNYSVPAIAHGSTIKVTAPDGTTETSQNPMYSYTLISNDTFENHGVKLDSADEAHDDAVRHAVLFLR